MKLRLKHKSARIELIPLIDIIFLLLVFFIYSMLSMVVYRGIPVTLPSAGSVETEKGKALPLIITIDENGAVFVDKKPTPGRELLCRLKKEQGDFPEKTVVISGHSEVSYRVFVDVLDKVRLAGFSKVSMEARPGEPDTK